MDFLSNPNNPINALLKSMGYAPPSEAPTAPTRGVTGSWEEPASVATPMTTAQPELSTLLAQIAQEQGNKGIASPLSTEVPDLNGSFDAVQALVTDLMKNNSAFRESVGYKDPAKAKVADPLAAGPDGWNLPKTGVVNTTGASQRINARTGETGVTATTDANGRTVLSNMGPGNMSANLQSAHATFDVGRQSGKNPLQMDSLIAQLRGVSSTAEASVIMDSIRATVTSEQTKINAQAFTFASNKLGIPSMEQTLRDSEINDKASPSWFQGIGDSPGTKSIRTQLQILRNQAGEQANEFLQTNLASGMLKNSLLAAGEELRRIDSKEKRTEGIADRITLGKEARAQEKADEAAAVIMTLPPSYAAHLKVLNPNLRNDPESAITQAAFAKEVKNLTKDGGKNPRMAAIKAAAQESGNELIGLSVEGNLDAKTLLRSAELLKNPSLKDEAFDAKIRSITKMADSNEFVKTYIDDKYKPSERNSEAARADTMRLNAAKQTGTTEEKATARRERIGIAISLARKNATGEYMKDLSSWGSNDTAFRTAYTETLQKRGTADFATVMETYMGASTGPDALQKGFALTAIANEAFARAGGSVFGRPDSSAALKMISDKVRHTGIGSSLAELMSKAASAIPGVMLYNSMTDMAKPLRDKFTVTIDPTTGLPYPKQ